MRLRLGPAIASYSGDPLWVNFSTWVAKWISSGGSNLIPRISTPATSRCSAWRCTRRSRSATGESILQAPDMIS